MVVYLAHHGIDGQKWGKRNGPPYPLDYEQHSAEQKKKNPKSELNNYANNNPKDSNKNKALSDRAKMLIAAGLFVGGGAAAYCVVRNKNINSDFTLGKGTNVFRIASSSDNSLHDVFYAATNKLDSMKYKGIYGMQKKAREKAISLYEGSDNIYQKVITAKSDIKVAGKNSAETAFNELMSENSEFNRAVKKEIKKAIESPLAKANALIRKPKTNMSDYEKFNLIIGQMDNTITKSFFDKLSSKGYGGVIDVNDSKYSGYESKQPVIFFNHSNNVEVSSSRKISSGEIALTAIPAGLITEGEKILKNPVTLGAAISAIGVGSLSIKEGQEYVDKSLNKSKNNMNS